MNLSEVDPNQQVLPQDLYTLKILKAEKKDGVSKSTGKDYSMVKMIFAVVDHPEFSGRRLYDSFFPNPGGLKALRRVMDATGIAQVAGEPLTDWLKQLSVEQPTFKTFIKVEDDVDKNGDALSLDFKGETAKRNRINWYQVQPA